MKRPIRISLSLLVGFLMVLGLFAQTNAQSSPYMSAEESDPKRLGWMTGFPPSPGKLIMQPESDFFSFPKLRWTVCHIRELMPTKQVNRGIGPTVPLDYAIDDSIDAVTFTPAGAGKSMTWKESLSANYTDGILILHKGRVVYEKYFGCLDEMAKHAAMSMTKSITGLLAEVLVVEGRLDDKVKVSSILPDLRDSAFGSATVRQIMDRRSTRLLLRCAP
ncbi:serine hydrolase domain-containing protein [Marinobacter sp. ATCH36]|uniref:serine hydrolase n=1 Tax=Marinobacter sp. ATCH36 TaxID=2945106 RepID=UPI0020206984|nr:serine hydrolase domain-containing protein [Marinobacter sp. ATCH36]MCL7945319.1 beta-lactamase family protein [Marinobacter sp. ATCH36]